MTFLILTIVSAVALLGFITIGLVKFGLLQSYSAYATKWLEKYPNFSIWAFVTIVAAFLLVPPLIEVGSGHTLQFIGFLTPVYLIVVGLTPRWASNVNEHIVHSLFAGLCAAGAILWAIFIAHTWICIVYCAIFIFLVSFLTRTFMKGATFYLEMIAFLAIYSSLIYLFI